MILCKVKGSLGDTVCATGALRNLRNKINSDFFVETDYPSLFEDEPYVIKSCYSFYEEHDLDLENFYQNFDRIYIADYFTEAHLQSKINIAESYCEYLQVDKTTKPFIHIDFNKFNKFNYLEEEPFIVVSLTQYHKRKLSYNYSKALSEGYAEKIKKAINEEFNIKVVDINSLGYIDNKKELLYLAMKATTFVSVDGALVHFCSNEPTFKKGICLYRNEACSKSFGYKDQINIISDTSIIGPYVEIDKIIKELKCLNQKN